MEMIIVNEYYGNSFVSSRKAVYFESSQRIKYVEDEKPRVSEECECRSYFIPTDKER